MVVATLAMPWNEPPTSCSSNRQGQSNVKTQIQSFTMPPMCSSSGDFEDHHRCRRTAALVASQSCPSLSDRLISMHSRDDSSVAFATSTSYMISSSLPINFESILAASLQATVVSSHQATDSSDFVDVDEAKAALNSLVIDGHRFVSSSPQKSGDATAKGSNVSITTSGIDILSMWDCCSPPDPEPHSCDDERLALNSSENSQSIMSSSSGFSSSCSSFIVSSTSSPLSVSTTSSSSQCSSSSNSDVSNSTLKRRVHFADTHGKPLAVVCTFNDTPIGSIESGSAKFLNQVKKTAYSSNESSAAKDADSVELLFPDPLCDYNAMTEKLQQNNVALESVCCRGGLIKGMIRVRNLSFSKHVFVRITFDQWTTSADWSADFFPIVAPSDGTSYYDLFEFSIPIPPHLMPGTVAEFCICFKRGDVLVEYWDNNKSKNYSLRYRPISAVSSSQRQPKPQFSPTPLWTPSLKHERSLSPQSHHRSAVEMDRERTQRIRDFVWSEFTSWNGGNSIVGNRAGYVEPARNLTTMVTSVTTSTSPAGKDMPYW